MRLALAGMGMAFGLLTLAGPAAAQSACDRLRIYSLSGDVQVQGLYDFCNEYRQLQAEVQRLSREVQTLEQKRRQAERMDQIGGASIPVAQLLRGATGAKHAFELRQPAVLLATAHGTGPVRIALDGETCTSGTGATVCQRPLDPGKHTVVVDGTDVTLSLAVTAR